MLRLPLVDRVVDQLKAAMNGSDDSAWLLAASGGRDSTVLAHLLRQAKIPYALAHMNYGLRGEESERDERFVRDLALHLGVPVYVECVDAAPMKGNRQAICRTLRYNWLYKLCLEHSFIGILTAHHADDQAETVLMALLKGRGLRARAGMDFTVGRVYRPLLTTSSEEIEEWVTDNEIEYMVDSSNRSLRYDRNYVRHVLSPLLNARFPNWQQNLLERSSVWRSYSKKREQSALVESHRIIVEDAHGLMR
ncbi:MAG: tRNA lysidine(34) synthetase TilS, partial [Bacteroidetes bacterium]|nr:tRNA lysidine(34) synthetase TilS [Bacteroidota bacterium]